MEICYLRQNGLCLQLNFVCFNSTNQIIFQGPSIGFGRRFDVLQKAVGDIHITSQMEFSRTGCLQMFPVGFSAEYGEPIGMLWNAKIWNQSAGEWTVITIGFRDSTWGFGWHFAGFYFSDLFYFLWFWVENLRRCCCSFGDGRIFCRVSTWWLPSRSSSTSTKWLGWWSTRNSICRRVNIIARETSKCGTAKLPRFPAYIFWLVFYFHSKYAQLSLYDSCVY